MNRDWQSAGWPVVRIRDIGRLHGGGTPSRKRPEYFKGTIPWITGQDIPESYVAEITTARDFVTEEAVNESATRVAPAGTVLVTTRVSVGKTAVAGRPICFSQDVTAIIIHSAAIALPTYVAYFLRSRREALLQKNQGSTIAGITRDTLALEQIPLPPVSEQQRMVEILQEAEAIRCLRAEIEAKTVTLVPAMFQFAVAQSMGENGMRKKHRLEEIAYVQGGIQVTRARENAPLKVPYLRVANVQRDALDLEELKEIGVTEAELERTRLQKGDILVVEGHGNPNELGRAAVWTGEIDPCTHQNHLIRVRCKPGNDPAFVLSMLNSALGRRHFLTSGNTTSGLNTISTSIVKNFRMPIIPAEILDEFSRLREAATGLNNPEIHKANLIANALAVSLSAHAFSGLLTADWREVHAAMLAVEARERDEAVKQAGTALSRTRSKPVQEEESIYDFRTDGIYSDLNREQRDLFLHIQQQNGRVGDVRYFTAQSLSQSLEGSLRRNPQAIEGHLAVFAVRGLIISVSREEQTEDTGEYVFGNAYRLPLKDRFDRHRDGSDEMLETDDLVGDYSRGRELERLAAQLEKERYLT